MRLILNLCGPRHDRTGYIDWLSGVIPVLVDHYTRLLAWSEIRIIAEPEFEERLCALGLPVAISILPRVTGPQRWITLRDLFAGTASPGGGGLVYLERDSLWLDEGSMRFTGAVDLAGKRGGVFSRQPGNEYLYFREEASLFDVPENSLNPFFFAKSNLGVRNPDWMAERSQPRGLAYLKGDQTEGREAIRKALAGELDPYDADGSDYEWFAVANLTHLKAVIARIDHFRPLENLRVLEIAASPDQSSIPKLLFEHYGIQSYVGVNLAPFTYDYGSDECQLICSDIHAVNFEPGSFDLCFSIAAWEHLPNPGAIFMKISEWLAPGGIHYGIFFGWSGPKGHHLISGRPLADRIPSYAQFNFDEDSLRQYFEDLGDVSKEDAAKGAHWVFRHGHVNRVHTADFLRFMDRSGLETIYLDGRSNGRFIAGAEEAAKKTKRYTRSQLSAQGLEFVLRKSQYKLRSIVDKPSPFRLALVRGMKKGRRLLSRLKGLVLRR